MPRLRIRTQVTDTDDIERHVVDRLNRLIEELNTGTDDLESVIVELELSVEYLEEFTTKLRLATGA